MKKLVFLFSVFCLFLMKTSSAQDYQLSLIFEQEDLGSLDQAFVADGKIYTKSQHLGPVLYDKNEDVLYNISQEGNSVLHIHGVFEDGQAYVYHNVSDKAYAFNRESMSFDLFSSPIKLFVRNFVYEKDKVYICTGPHSSYNDLARLYLWDGANNFEVLLESEIVFEDIYVKSQEEIIAIESLWDGSAKILKFDGENINELAERELEYEGDYFRHIYSNDGEIFFIQSFYGFVYKYELSSNLLERIYYDPDKAGYYSSGLFVFDNNEDVIIFGAGVLQIKASNGDTSLIRDYVGGDNIMGGYYDQENDEAYFVSESSKIYQLVGDGNSISSSLENEFRIYPNPANDVLNFSHSSLGEKNVKIIDLSGKVLYSKSFSGSNFQILLSDFKTGMYFVRLESLDGIFSKKLLIE